MIQRSRVLEFFRQNPQGVNARYLRDKLGINRVYLVRVLDSLVSEGRLAASELQKAKRTEIYSLPAVPATEPSRVSLTEIGSVHSKLIDRVYQLFVPLLVDGGVAGVGVFAAPQTRQRAMRIWGRSLTARRSHPAGARGAHVLDLTKIGTGH